MTDYITEQFDGVVQLTSNNRYQDPVRGTWFSCIAGKVTIMEDKDLVGFKTRSTDSNWIARIEGPSGRSINILGCKVHSVTAFNKGMPTIDAQSSPDVFMVP